MKEENGGSSMKIMRQGDILLKKIDSVPKEATQKDNVLAYGETTGHKHLIRNGRVIIDNNGRQFVVSEQDTQLVHEEHETLDLEEGAYEVVQQREFDIVEGTRRVLD